MAGRWATFAVMSRCSIFCCGLLLLTGLACNDAESAAADAPPPLSEALLGTWETVEMEATANSYEGRDTTVRTVIREADWGKMYGSKPPRTVFTADGKLRRTYYNVNGQETDVTHGLWKVRGTDSLFVIEPNTTLSYRHQLDGSRLTLTGVVDWDYDGRADDDYRAVLRLVARTTD